MSYSQDYSWRKRCKLHNFVVVETYFRCRTFAYEIISHWNYMLNYKMQALRSQTYLENVETESNEQKLNKKMLQMAYFICNLMTYHHQYHPQRRICKNDMPSQTTRSNNENRKPWADSSSEYLSTLCYNRDVKLVGYSYESDVNMALSSPNRGLLVMRSAS